MAISFYVVFQQGGEQRSEWRYIPQGYASREAAEMIAQSIVNAGRPAYVYPQLLLEVAGLPPDNSPADQWDYRNLKWGEPYSHWTRAPRMARMV